jgi:hypothetical protein
MLVSDCKPKIAKTLSVCNKTLLADDSLYLTRAREILQPWRGVFKPQTLHDMVTSQVAPRLARALLGSTAKPKHLVAFVDTALQWNSLGLLPNVIWTSLLEGAALPAWTKHIHDALSSGTAPCEVVDESYKVWKKRLYPFLKGDAALCSWFHVVLLMLRAAANKDLETLNKLEPPAATATTSYQVILARRVAQQKQRAGADLMRVLHQDDELAEARVRLLQSTSSTTRGTARGPTFREVVAEYAREHDILFQPKISGSSIGGGGTSSGGAMVDGHPVFVFGSIPVYLDSNVVYCYDPPRQQWQPIALQELVQKVVGSSSSF